MTRITILLATTGLLLFASASDAADCKYVENERDPFTDQRIVETKWKTFRPTGNQAVNHGWMAGWIKDDKTFLALRIGIPAYSGGPLVIAKSAPLLLLMADDTVMELTAYQETWVKSRNVVILYELDADALAALTAQGTSDIRVTTNDGDHDFNFGSKPTDKIQFVLSCLPPL
jgi:hypothetical protein